MKPILIALAAAAALAAAGCGSSNKSSASAPAAHTTGAPTTNAAPAATTPGGGAKTSSGTLKIDMKNIAFAPKSVQAKVGQKIEWTNSDSVDHNVTADSGGDFKSKDFGQGGTYSYTADKAGTIKYECTLHPGMTGTITVSG